MGRKARQALRGLEALGTRLKQIRLAAGLSQMRLARCIGFDPAHGYKYILRLEKGRVPNPTLRTIAACLQSCGADWRNVADVLPHADTAPAPATGAANALRRAEVSPDADMLPDSPAAGPRPPTAAPRRKDSRPMREQLRSRRIEQRTLHNLRFWAGVKQADEATAALLHSLRVPLNLQRSYLSFTRACCSAIAAFVTARPELAERELAKLLPPAVAQGLDRGVLVQIQAACTRILGTQPKAG